MKEIYRGFKRLEGTTSVPSDVKELVYRGVGHVLDPALINYPDGQMREGVYRGVRWTA